MEFKRYDKFIDTVVHRIKMEKKYFGNFRCDRNDKYINNILSSYGYNLYKILDK